MRLREEGGRAREQGVQGDYALAHSRLGYAQYKTAKYIPPKLESPDIALLVGIGSSTLATDPSRSCVSGSMWRALDLELRCG